MFYHRAHLWPDLPATGYRVQGVAVSLHTPTISLAKCPQVLSVPIETFIRLNAGHVAINPTSMTTTYNLWKETITCCKETVTC